MTDSAGDIRIEHCRHENFRADVTVNRLEDSGAFIADVKVACTDCDTPFHFVNVPIGLNFHGPTANIDRTELHVPLAPGPDVKFIQNGGVARYQM